MGGHSETAWFIGIISVEDPSRLAFRGLHLGRVCICSWPNFGISYLNEESHMKAFRVVSRENFHLIVLCTDIVTTWTDTVLRLLYNTVQSCKHYLTTQFTTHLPGIQYISTN
jgi:hypothetical protein